jgi:hypothetical protein
MWLFTNTGFVSAVSNGKDLMVRARDKESLEPIAESDKADKIQSFVFSIKSAIDSSNSCFVTSIFKFTVCLFLNAK